MHAIVTGWLADGALGHKKRCANLEARARGDWEVVNSFKAILKFRGAKPMRTRTFFTTLEVGEFYSDQYKSSPLTLCTSSIIPWTCKAGDVSGSSRVRLSGPHDGHTFDDCTKFSFSPGRITMQEKKRSFHKLWGWLTLFKQCLFLVHTSSGTEFPSFS